VGAYFTSARLRLRTAHAGVVGASIAEMLPHLRTVASLLENPPWKSTDLKERGTWSSEVQDSARLVRALRCSHWPAGVLVEAIGSDFAKATAGLSSAVDDQGRELGFLGLRFDSAKRRTKRQLRARCARAVKDLTMQVVSVPAEEAQGRPVLEQECEAMPVMPVSRSPAVDLVPNAGNPLPSEGLGTCESDSTVVSEQGARRAVLSAPKDEGMVKHNAANLEGTSNAASNEPSKTNGSKFVRTRAPVDSSGNYENKSVPASRRRVCIAAAVLLGAAGIHRFLLGDVKGGVIRIGITVLTAGYGGVLFGWVEGMIYLRSSDEAFVERYQVRRRAWF